MHRRVRSLRRQAGEPVISLVLGFIATVVIIKIVRRGEPKWLGPTPPDVHIEAPAWPCKHPNERLVGDQRGYAHLVCPWCGNVERFPWADNPQDAPQDDAGYDHPTS